MEHGQVQALQLQINGCSGNEWSITSLYYHPRRNLTPTLVMTDSLSSVNKVRHEFRQIFFEMGFEEMPTNRCVALVLTANHTDAGPDMLKPASGTSTPCSYPSSIPPATNKTPSSSQTHPTPTHHGQTLKRHSTYPTGHCQNLPPIKLQR